MPVLYLDDAPSEVIYLGHRMVILPGRPAQLAADRFASPLQAAVPVADGWIFVTADGTVARSDTFLGPARVLQRLPCAHRLGTLSRGRLVVIDPDGRLSTTDGRGPLAPTALPGPVLDAGFSVEGFGAAVLRDGRLFLTSDQGQHWSACDLQNDVAARVRADRDGLRVDTTSGSRRVVSNHGVLRLAPPSPPPIHHVALPSPGPESSLAERLPLIASPPGDCPEHLAPVGFGTPPFRHLLCSMTSPPPALAGTALWSLYDSASGTAVFTSFRPGRSGADDVPPYFSWRGVDDLVTFAASSRRAPASATGFPYNGDQTRALLLGGTRRGALLGLSAETNGQTEHALGWGVAGGEFTPVRVPGMDSIRCQLNEAIALPDGGAAVSLDACDGSYPLGLEHFDAYYRAGSMLTVARDGGVTSRRGFIGARAGRLLPMLARWGGDAGPVVLDPSDPDRLVALTRAPHPFPVIDWEHLGPCREQTAPEIVVAVQGLGVSLDLVDRPDATSLNASASAELEIHGASACIRSMTGRVSIDPIPGPFLLTAQPDGTFGGDLHCRPR